MLIQIARKSRLKDWVKIAKRMNKFFIKKIKSDLDCK